MFIAHLCQWLHESKHIKTGYKYKEEYKNEY